MQKTDLPLEFKPYISHGENLPEFTLRAILVGAVFGVLFGSANAYLGLRVGLTISTSIPIAVLSVALFKSMEKVWGKASILESNISQTTGSASSSLASGIIFTIPALFLWGYEPELIQLAVLGLMGGMLGIGFMIFLRRFLIVKEHATLPYPEGTAAAEVLIAADKGGGMAREVFKGLGIGALYKAVLAFGKLWPSEVDIRIPGMKKAEIGLEASPALLGVGYILGYRISAIMVAGGLLSWLGIIPAIALFGDKAAVPFFPETKLLIQDMSPFQIWTRYVRYIGAGAVAVAGIITVVRALPTMYDSLRVGLQGLRPKIKDAPAAIRTDLDLHVKWILAIMALVILVSIFSPYVIGLHSSLTTHIIGSFAIVLFAFIFVTVSSRIVGLVGVSSNPTSGMTIVTLLGTAGVFFLLGWTDSLSKAAVLTIGTVVAVSASIAGDTSQDLKTGYLLGATPQKQQMGELLGVLTSAVFIALAVMTLGEAYGFGTREIPAPQATLMKTVVDGVLQANLPWGLVLIGASFALVAELLSVPSLPLAVGIYLPLSTMTPIYVGGLIRKYVERKKGMGEKTPSQAEESSSGVLLSSGLIAGEGIMGVLVAAYAFSTGTKPEGFSLGLSSLQGQMLSFAIFSGLSIYLLFVSVKNKVAR